MHALKTLTKVADTAAGVGTTNSNTTTTNTDHHESSSSAQLFSKIVPRADSTNNNFGETVFTGGSGPGGGGNTNQQNAQTSGPGGGPGGPGGHAGTKGSSSTQQQQQNAAGSGPSSSSNNNNPGAAAALNLTSSQSMKDSGPGSSTEQKGVVAVAAPLNAIFKASREKSSGKEKKDVPERQKLDPSTMNFLRILKRELDRRNRLTLNDLSVFGTIGKGAFGRVRYVRLRETVFRSGPLKAERVPMALKIMNKVRIAQIMGGVSVASSAIKQEITLLKDVEFPFIVNLITFWHDSKRIYLAMECVNGGELFKLIYGTNADTILTIDVGRRIFAELVLTMEDLHARSIIYRDLKPENVLLDSAGRSKLVDFGLAKQLDKEIPRTKTNCGTLAYQAPEILLNYSYSYTVKKSLFCADIDWVGVLNMKKGHLFKPQVTVFQEHTVATVESLEGDGPELGSSDRNVWNATMEGLYASTKNDDDDEDGEHGKRRKKKKAPQQQQNNKGQEQSGPGPGGGTGSLSLASAIGGGGGGITNLPGEVGGGGRR